MPATGSSQSGWTKAAGLELGQQCRQHLSSLFAAVAWDGWLASQVQMPYSCNTTDYGLYEIKVRPGANKAATHAATLVAARYLQPVSAS